MNIAMREYNNQYNEELLTIKYNILKQIIIEPKICIDSTYKPNIETTDIEKKITINRPRQNNKISGGEIIIITS